MAVLSLQMTFPGQVGLIPRRGKMATTDSITACQVAGYLKQGLYGEDIMNGDLIDAQCSNGDEVFVAAVSNSGIITLAIFSTGGIVPSWVTNTNPGTSAPGTAIVLDDSGDIDGQAFTQIEAAGTYVSALTVTPTQVNTTASAGAVPAWVTNTTQGVAAANTGIWLDSREEYNGVNATAVFTQATVAAGVFVTDLPAILNTTTVPATGSCAVTLTFETSAAVSVDCCGIMVLSDGSGNLGQSGPVTSFTQPSPTGYIVPIASGTVPASNQAFFFSTSGGTLTFTVTATAGNYWLTWLTSLETPSNSTTTVIVVN